jgi:hypothetical protein
VKGWFGARGALDGDYHQRRQLLPQALQVEASPGLEPDELLADEGPRPTIWLATPQLSASSIDLLAKSRHRPQSVRSPSLAAILLTVSSHALTKIKGAWGTQAPTEKWGSMQAINDS